MAVTTKRKIESKGVILWEKGQGNILYALIFNYLMNYFIKQIEYIYLKYIFKVIKLFAMN